MKWIAGLNCVSCKSKKTYEFGLKNYAGCYDCGVLFPTVSYVKNVAIGFTESDIMAVKVAVDRPILKDLNELRDGIDGRVDGHSKGMEMTGISKVGLDDLEEILEKVEQLLKKYE